jgi:hypothetical protein
MHVTLPRGGEGSSEQLPVFAYTLKGPAPAAEQEVDDDDEAACKAGGAGEDENNQQRKKRDHHVTWHRSVLTRSGRGETLRGGGSRVTIEITPEGRKQPLCAALLRLDLVASASGDLRTPLFTVWTERMSGELGSPSYVAVREDGSS